MKNNEKGRSMVEMLGVLAIIGVLSAGGLAGYSKAMFKHKMNSTMDQITMLVTNIRTMYGMQGTYDGLSVDTALKLGIVPAAMKAGNKTSQLVSPFKGPVRIGLNKTHAAALDKTAFTITLEDLPVEACINLATADWGLGAGSGFIGVNAAATASGASADALYTGTNTEGQALSMSEALTACGGDAGAAKTSSVAFKFY